MQEKQSAWSSGKFFHKNHMQFFSTSTTRAYWLMLIHSTWWTVSKCLGFFVIFPEIAFFFRFYSMNCYYMLHLPALCGVCRGPIACISEVTGNGFVCKQPPVFSCLRKVSVIVACAIARNVHQGYMGGLNHLRARKKSSIYTHVTHLIGTFT